MIRLILLTIFILSLFVYGCSSPKGNDVCSAACAEQGFTEGTCETLGVMPDPCETKLNKTTIHSQERICEEYGKDKVSWWQWNVGRVRYTGIGNMCCCS